MHPRPAPPPRPRITILRRVARWIVEDITQEATPLPEVADPGTALPADPRPVAADIAIPPIPELAIAFGRQPHPEAPPAPVHVPAALLHRLARPHRRKEW